MAQQFEAGFGDVEIDVVYPNNQVRKTVVPMEDINGSNLKVHEVKTFLLGKVGIVNAQSYMLIACNRLARLTLPDDDEIINHKQDFMTEGDAGRLELRLR